MKKQNNISTNNFKKYLLFIFMLQSGAIQACVNEYRTLISGKVVYTDVRSGRIYVPEKEKEQIEQQAKELYDLYLESDNIEHYSDYASQLIYLNEYEKAKTIYKEIEAEYPDRYITASNLGTIYELQGKADSALLWIEKSIQLNPKSHQGSEWIHVMILKHKLQKEAPKHLSVLNLDFGNGIRPMEIKGMDQREVMYHIYYQLKERLQFINPPNQIIGSLYFDYGNLLAQKVDLESALEAYKEAKRFGFNASLLEKRVEGFEDMISKAVLYQKVEDLRREKGWTGEKIIMWGLLTVFLMILMISFGIHRYKSRNKND